MTQLHTQIAKVKVLQNLVASRVDLSFQNSKDLIDQSDIISPSLDDLKLLDLKYFSKISITENNFPTYNAKECTLSINGSHGR